MKIRKTIVSIISVLSINMTLAGTLEKESFNIHFTNNSLAYGEVAAVALDGIVTKGPSLGKGETTEWIYTPGKGNLKSFIGLSTGNSGYFCFAGGKNLYLDMSRYENDVIYITYDNLSSNSSYVQCSCNGSACA